MLIDGDRYLLELVRYIHCNSTRSKIVRNPENYPWSSHTAYLGKTEIPWLTKDFVLAQFAKSTNKAKRLFADFDNTELQKSIDKNFIQEHMREGF